MEQWLTELCPACSVKNWLHDEESAEEDIGIFRCWKCQADIALFAGEFHEEHNPHVNGSLPEDEDSFGRFVYGLKEPT